MLVGYACPMECPIYKRAGNEHNDRIRQDNAPIRENPLVKVVGGEFGKPIMIVISHEIAVIPQIVRTTSYLLSPMAHTLLL